MQMPLVLPVDATADLSQEIQLDTKLNNFLSPPGAYASDLSRPICLPKLLPISSWTPSEKQLCVAVQRQIEAAERSREFQPGASWPVGQ